MGLKFNPEQKVKKEPSSSPKEDQINMSNSSQSLDKSRMEQLWDWLKSNKSSILIGISIVLLIGLVMKVVGGQVKHFIIEFLNEHKHITFESFCLLVVFGALMIIVGAPVLIFELSLGCALEVYVVAVAIAAMSKMVGIIISYVIAQRYLKQYILAKMRDNLYLKILRKMSKDQPSKAITILAIIQIPMVVKNYSLPLFDVHLKYIISIFYSTQVIQSCLFCFIGSTFASNSNGKGNVEEQHSMAKDILTYFLYALTILLFYLIYRETQKIKESAHLISNYEEFDEENNTHQLEILQKISYLSSQELQNSHSIKLVIPQINNED